MNEVQEKLIDKIRKLLNHADGTNSQAEADSFIAKANKLLLEHNLSMSQIETTEDKSKNGITEDKKAVDFGKNKSEGNRWETLLMGVLCSHNMCDSIIHTKRQLSGGSISIIGSISNIETVKYLFDVAREMIRNISKTSYKEYREETLSIWDNELTEKELLNNGQLSYRMPWIRNYLKGAVLGLNKKLDTLKRQMEESLSQVSSESRQEFGLMIMGNKEAIELYKKEEYSDLTERPRSTQINDKSAYRRGFQDGEAINLFKGVGYKQEHTNQLN